MNKTKTTILLLTLLVVAMVANAGVKSNTLVTNNENGDYSLTSQEDQAKDKKVKTLPFCPVDWKKIKATVSDYPDSVKALVNKMVALEDPKLTDEETILAFFGQSYISEEGEESLLSDVGDSLNIGNYLGANRVVDEVLKINPLNLKARYLKIVILLIDKEKAETPTLYSIEEFMHQQALLLRLGKAITLSGDGTEKNPFYVTSISDEYTYMGLFLNINGKDIAQQGVMNDKKHPCDYFDLKNKNENYNHDTIYFEITRVFEIENAMFNGK